MTFRPQGEIRLSPTFILNKKDQYSRRLHRFAYAITASWLALVMACSLGRGGKEPSLPASFSSTRSEGFTNFETEPVSPLALSADGRYLYALNTADDRLEIFAAQGESLRAFGETTVGLRPVALALRENTAWVVNHLSDSVSVVDVSDPSRPRVMHSLQVGDEPRGIVVAGKNRDRVFVATARLGESFTPGIGRAQIWVFDATRPEAPPRILTLFGTKPRALATSADGRFVYAAVYLSGNGTTTVSGEDAVRLGRARQLSLNNIRSTAFPKQGAIVQDHAAVVIFHRPRKPNFLCSDFAIRVLAQPGQSTARVIC